MVWKVEEFKYEKMRTKGVPFGYLEFSHAFRGKHAHTRTRRHRRPPRSSLAPAAGVWCTGAALGWAQFFLYRATRVRRIPKLDPSGSHKWGLEDPTRSTPAFRSGQFTPTDRNRSERFHLSGTIVMVLSELLQHFSPKGFQERYK